MERKYNNDLDVKGNLGNIQQLQQNQLRGLTKAERRQIAQEQELLRKLQKEEEKKQQKIRAEIRRRKELEEYRQHQYQLLHYNPDKLLEPKMDLDNLQLQKLQSIEQKVSKSGLFLGPSILNQKNSIFFRIGHNQLYSETYLVFCFYKDNKSWWAPVNNPNDIQPRELNIPKHVQIILHGKNLENSKKIGRFVLQGQRWGFLLDLTSSQDIYEGVLPQFWGSILDKQFFQEIFEKYAYYIMEEDEFNLKKEISISNTYDDPPVQGELIPFCEQMFIHQRKEVGWMFNYENDPNVTFPIDLSYIPLLDSGYYFHPSNPSKMITRSQIPSKTYKMPGGVLGSEIGSGKTISIIGLSTIGYELKQEKFLKYFQQDYQETQKEEQKYNEDDLIIFESSDSDEFEKITKKGQLDKSIIEKKEELTLKKQKSHQQQKKQKEFSKQLNFYEKNMNNGIYLPTLIVVTQNILFQWQEEYQKFAPFLRVIVVEDPRDFKNKIQKDIVISQDNKKIPVLKNYDIIITHRNALIQLQKEKIKTELFNIHFRRIVFDEFHEITNAYSQFQVNKKQNNYYQDNYDYYQMQQYSDQLANMKKYEKYMQQNIISLYEAVNLIKRDFTWGVTGTISNLAYRDGNEAMANLLKLPIEFCQENKFSESLKDSFVQNCIRANPRCVELPPLNKKQHNIYFGKLQNLIYQGKMNINQGERYAREICSHFIEQYKYLEHVDGDQFENAISVITKKLDKEIKDLQAQIDKCTDIQNIKYLEERMENFLGENNFYHEVIDVLTKEKFNFSENQKHKEITINQNQLCIKNTQNEKKGKLVSMEPMLQNGKKYEWDFQIQNVSINKSLSLGIYRQYSEFSINLDKNFYQEELIVKGNYATVKKFEKEEYKARNLRYQRYLMLEKPIEGDQFIYEIDFKIGSMDGKRLIAFGLCSPGLISGPKKFIHGLSDTELLNNIPQFIDEDNKIPYDRNILLGHGSYLIRADGMIYSHHDITINKYFKNVSFGEGDIVTLSIDNLNQILTVTNQKTKQFSQVQFTQINNEVMLPCVTLYSDEDEITLLDSRKKQQLSQFQFDGINNGHGAYMISGEGDILNDHDKDLNKSFTEQFSFEKGHEIKLTVDLIESQIIYTNLNNKKSYTQNIKVDFNKKYEYSPSFLMFSEQDQVKLLGQIYLFECPLCYEDLTKDYMVMTNCLHQICVICYEALTKKQYASCPYCKQDINDQQVMVHPKKKNEEKKESKLELLIKKIQETPVEDKVIVYTQFNDLTLHIADMFKEVNLEYLILRGVPSEINIRLNKFKKLPELKVLMMSIEQAASGINVVEANHVYFLHPIFGMEREKAEITYSQCIGRAYRIGQTKQVFSEVFVTKHSIEQNVVQPFFDSHFKYKNEYDQKNQKQIK